MSVLEETDFAAAVEPYRRELQLHCYRMLGSYEESEDLTQETFLRAWRKRDQYAARASVRAWLYRIATNACLDALDKQPRHPTAEGELEWLQPFPDELLPHEVVVDRETIELVFLIAIQYLPPRTRAVLILRDVLGWRARETAELLETSVTAVNSALQRARATLKQRLPAERGEWTAEGSLAERAVVERFVEATQAGDAEGLKLIMHEQATFMMPPNPGVYVGGDTIVDSWFQGGLGSEGFGELKLVLTRANRQPALANYHRKPGEDRFTAFALDVLRIENGKIRDVTAFESPDFAAFGLPEVL